MKESKFVKIFEKAARDAMGTKAIVRNKAALLYSLSLNQKLELSVANPRRPTRGQSAFETDICVFEEIDGVELPRVIIEFKERITTHDILTYSAKAGKHKQIYPWLRYGMLASEISYIPTRFFTHNDHFDFFIAAKDYQDSSKVRALAKNLIEKELETSRKLEAIHFAGEKVNYFSRDIMFKPFDIE